MKNPRYRCYKRAVRQPGDHWFVSVELFDMPKNVSWSAWQGLTEYEALTQVNGFNRVHMLTGRLNTQVQYVFWIDSNCY